MKARQMVRIAAEKIWKRLPIYKKPVFMGLSAAGLIVYIWMIFIQPTSPNFHSMVGFDSYAYWYVNPFHPYVAPLGSLSSFTYSPAFALVSPFSFSWPLCLLSC